MLEIAQARGLRHGLTFVKKRLIIGLAGAGFALAAVFLLFGLSSETSFYQGRSIESWARLAYANDGNAMAAFQGMGTNAVPELIRLLNARDPFLRRQLWLLNGKIPSSLRRILPRIRPPDAAVVRGGAIRALGTLGPDARGAVVPLGRVLRRSNHQDSADASAALGRIGKASLPVLLEALEDRNATVRRPAVSALAQLGPDAAGAVPALAGLLLDPDRNVRELAGYALQVIGAPAVKALGDAMAAGDNNAQGAAVKALRLITGSLRQAEPGLLHMAQSGNPDLRRTAMEALGAIRIPDNATLRTLAQGLSDPVLEVRVAAANALANVSIRGQLAVPALVQALNDRSPELRSAAARTLGIIGTPAAAAVPKLTAMLNDSDGSIRGAAKEALARIAPCDSVGKNPQ